MERRYRLKKNRAFQYVYHKGHSVACRNLVMLLAPGRELKVGFSVSKKTGNAVTRNRIKRRHINRQACGERVFRPQRRFLAFPRAVRPLG